MSKKIRVAVADDHSLIRVGLCSIIEEQSDMELAGEAETGRGAIDLCRRENPDIILLDYSMPDIDGLQATRQIVSTCDNVRVIIITMHDNEEYAVRLMQSGASGFYIKGTSSEDLPGAIRKVASGKPYLTPSISEKIALRSMRGAGDDPVSTLSDRELQVVISFARGRTAKETAADLGLGYSTVENYKHRAMTKLELRTDADLARFAIRHGLIDEI